MRGALLLPLLALLGCAPRSTEPPAPSQGTQPQNVQATDAQALRLQSHMLDAMGGRRAWESARYFEFDFVVVRQGNEVARWRHRWDRWRGDYRLSGVRRGDSLVAVFNTSEPRAGRAWLSGRLASGASADSLLDFAYARFINDSYWLIMPYKWLDPGVHLFYQGRRTEAGREWEVVKLTFDNVGLTPQNQYLALINSETGLMERWYHYPREGADPAIFDWRDWQRFGPILLATSKPSADGATIIRFDNVRVETSVPKDAFAP